MSEETTGHEQHADPDRDEQPTIAASAERVVSHALFDYLDPTTGAPRTALFGQRIRVGGDDLARGERTGALTTGDLIVPGVVAAPPTPEVAAGSDPAPLPTAHGGHLEPLDPAAVAAVVGGQHGEAPDRPYQSSTVAVWREYVVKAAEHHGDTSMTRERADDMTKEQLIHWRPAAGTGPS